MANDPEWKTKYFDALRECETLERDWDRQEQVLRNAINRLSITAKGLSPRLDSLLATIQQHCKQKKDEMLSNDLDRLSEVIKEIDRPDAGEPYQWNEFAFDLSRRFEVPDTYRAELDQLKDQIPQMAADRALTRIAELINRLIRIDHANPDGVASGELLDELIERVASTFGSNEALERIRGEVAESEGELDWRTCLDQIVEQLRVLVREINRDKARLESLVVDVSQQLRDISNLLTEEQQEHVAGHEETLQLKNAMDQNVADMHQEITRGTSIDHLKSVLGANLDRIKHDLRELVEHDNQRYEHARRRNQELQQRMSQMEQESSELRRQIDDNRKKLMYDTLTGARTRLSYEELLDQEIARYARHQETFSFALFDIDHFKRINDNFGHYVGDNALRIVARMMTKHIRKTDFLFRIGGEEFAILLPRTTLDQAAPMVEEIRKAVGQSEFHYKKKRVEVSMSVGLTEVTPTDDASSIYRRADKALYTAKNSGRDQMVESRAVAEQPE